MGDNLNSKPESEKCEDLSEEEKREAYSCMIGVLVAFLFLVFVYVTFGCEDPMPEIKLVSLDFAAIVNNNNSTIMQQSHDLVSARWDLLIRVPKELVGEYMCLQGNLEASFLYKNVNLVTSSKQSYNILEPEMPQLLNVSAVASEKDLSGAIGEEIMEAIKERNEVRFGSRLTLTDCREDTEKGTMTYECDEATLRFEPSSSDQIKASAFGKHPTCTFIH